MRHIATTFGVSALGLAVAGCGIHDPYLTRTSATGPAPVASVTAATVGAPRPATMTTTGASTTPSPPSPALPGSRGTAHFVAYQFALAYANISPSGEQTRLRTMASLATPAYASNLLSGARQMSLEVIRGLPPGGRMVGQVSTIQLSPQRSFDHGVVTVDQVLTVRGRSIEPRFTSTFVIDILRVEGSWRVADFEAQP